jgi:hypothetical protein
VSAIFQIALRKVRVIENGRAEVGGAINALSATLYYPREGIPAITSVRSLSLEDNQELDYSTQPFQRQVLFKELIKGTAMLEVEITSKITVSRLDKFLAKIFGTVAKAAIGTVTGMGSILTGAIATASGPLFDLAKPKDQILVIGRGAMPIDGNTPVGAFPIQLSVPTEIQLQQTKTQNGKTVRRTKTLRENFVNGMVTFEITKIE